MKYITVYLLFMGSSYRYGVYNLEGIQNKQYRASCGYAITSMFDMQM